MKFTIFAYENKLRAVAGSRNFSDSNFADVSFALDTSSIRELYSYAKKLWNEARPLTGETANAIIEELNLSIGLEAMMKEIESGEEDEQTVLMAGHTHRR